MRFLASEKIGEHKYKTPEGYLICVDAILSRTGKQEYKRCELFGDTCDNADDVTYVNRTDDEVFSEASLASFENKAICLEHPDEDVNVENHNDLSIGFVRDIHKGTDNGQPVMMGTLVFTNKDAIELIESGEYKELSCGYDCDIEDNDELIQKNIRGNHIALCKQGRAGIARIVDAVDDMAVMRFEFSTNIAAFERAIINNDTAEFKSMLNVFEKDLADYKKWKREGRLSTADIGKVKRQVDKINSLLKKSKINKIFEVKDMAILKNVKKCDAEESGTDKIIYTMQSDIDKDLYFYIGEKYCMKEGNFGYTKFEMNDDTPEKIKAELTRNGWHQVAKGKASVIDYDWTEVEEENYEKANKNVVDSLKVKDARIGDATAYMSGEHNYVGNDYYGYFAVEHPEFGNFYVSFKIKGRRIEVQPDGTGWNFIKSKGYTAKQKAWIVAHKSELERIKGGGGNITDSKERLFAEKNYRDANVVDADNKLVCAPVETLFTVEYMKDGVKYIRKVRTNSIEDAISKVKDVTLPSGVKFIDDGYHGRYTYRGFELYWRNDLQSFGIFKDGSLVDTVEGLNNAKLPYELKKEVDMYYAKRPFWVVKYLD